MTAPAPIRTPRPPEYNAQVLRDAAMKRRRDAAQFYRDGRAADAAKAYNDYRYLNRCADDAEMAAVQHRPTSREQVDALRFARAALGR